MFNAVGGLKQNHLFDYTLWKPADWRGVWNCSMWSFTKANETLSTGYFYFIKVVCQIGLLTFASSERAFPS